MAGNDYPTVQNGAPVDADLWFNPVARDLTALKLATNVQTCLNTFDLTFPNQGGVFVDAFGMGLNVVGSAVYEVEWYLEVLGPTGIGLRFGFTMPAAAALSARWDGWNDATGVWAAAFLNSTTPWQAPLGYGFNGTASTSAIVGRGTLITASAGGTLQLQAAQRVNNASPANINKASWVSVRRIL